MFIRVCDQVWRSDDDAGTLLRIQTKDGAEFDQFAGDKPTHGFVPDQDAGRPKHEVRLDYADGQQHQTDLSTGDQVWRSDDDAGTLQRIQTKEGAELDQFAGEKPDTYNQHREQAARQEL